MDEHNALIESVTISNERGLSIWLHLNYGGSGQGFGGYLLYAPKGFAAHKDKGNFAGHFIYRVMEVAEVDDWNKLQGKTIRVRRDDGKIYEIGHIIKNDWFNPEREFEALKGA